jgi:hypothetical protein
MRGKLGDKVRIKQNKLKKERLRLQCLPKGYSIAETIKTI